MMPKTTKTTKKVCRTPSGVAHPSRGGAPLKGWRTPEGVAHPSRGGAPLKGWRPPVSNRYNHHLVDDSRAWRGATATLRSGSEDGSDHGGGGGPPPQSKFNRNTKMKTPDPLKF